LEPVVQWDGKQWSRIAFAEEAGFTLNVYRDELIIGGVLQNVDSVPTRGIARLACTFPTCAADFNSDGVVNSEDFFQFLTALLSEAPSADINHDSMVDSQDLFTFIAAFFSDC
jgi:hypothetical protein